MSFYTNKRLDFIQVLDFENCLKIKKENDLLSFAGIQKLVIVYRLKCSLKVFKFLFNEIPLLRHFFRNRMNFIPL